MRTKNDHIYLFTGTSGRSTRESRGVTWGRNLVVPDNETDTYIHEYIHFIQQVRTGFATMQAKGIFEQIRASFSSYYDPYQTLGTNEYEADKFANYFLKR